MKKLNTQQYGFSLVEVLIAVLIFSFGLLGIAGLMTVSIRNNHNGYMRSQAILISNSIESSMRANITGLWLGAYNGDMPNDSTITCNLTSRCDYKKLAQYDMETWGILINQLLPNGTGVIDCETPTIPAGIISSGLWQATPPFSGICNITIGWNESNELGNTPQTVNFVLQP